MKHDKILTPVSIYTFKNYTNTNYKLLYFLHQSMFIKNKKSFKIQNLKKTNQMAINLELHG